MAHYENEELGVSFSLPERFTVRENLNFRGHLGRVASDSAFIRYWVAALPIIEDWQCALIPDPAALDMDTETDARIADIVQWTANSVAGHMLALVAPEKN